MKRRIGAPALRALLVAGLALLPACAQRVWVREPARVTLMDYGLVGLVEFEAGEPGLAMRATREFQQRLLQARPGVRLVPLDSLEAAGELDAVFVGTVEFTTDSSIGVGAGSILGVQARTELHGSLSVQLVAPDSGATLWMGSSSRTATVTSAGLDSAGRGGMSVGDAGQARLAMTGELAQDVTHDFRDQYFRRKRDDVPPHYHPTYEDGVEVYTPAR